MTKEELVAAIQLHSDEDATEHAGLLTAVQGFDGDTDKLEKMLVKHTDKTDDGHVKLIEEANAL